MGSTSFPKLTVLALLGDSLDGFALLALRATDCELVLECKGTCDVEAWVDGFGGPGSVAAVDAPCAYGPPLTGFCVLGTTIERFCCCSETPRFSHSPPVVRFSNRRGFGFEAATFLTAVDGTGSTEGGSEIARVFGFLFVVKRPPGAAVGFGNSSCSGAGRYPDLCPLLALRS